MNVVFRDVKFKILKKINVGINNFILNFNRILRVIFGDFYLLSIE